MEGLAGEHCVIQGIAHHLKLIGISYKRFLGGQELMQPGVKWRKAPPAWTTCSRVRKGPNTALSQRHSTNILEMEMP